MSADTNRSGRGLRVVLWAGRILAAVLLAVTVVVVVVDVLNPSGAFPTASEWVSIAFFPIGVSVGYVLGWRWPLLGGTASVGCVCAAALWLFIERDSLIALRVMPILLVFMVPAILFIVYGVRARSASKGRGV